MIFRSGQESSINFSLPQVAIIERVPTPIVRAVSTNVAGVVLQTTRGNVGTTIYEVGDMSEYSRKLGDYAAGSDYLWAKNYFDMGGGLLKVVRAACSGTAAASAFVSGALTSAASGGLFTLVFDTVGTAGNTTKVRIDPNPNASYFDIEIRHGQEIMSYQRASTSSTDSNYIATLVTQDANAFCTISMVNTSGIVPLSGTTTMSGGSDGTTVGTSLDDSYYIGTDDSNGRTGIQKFIEDTEVIYVLSARNNTTINAALVTHVDSLTVTARRTILTFAAATSVATAVAYAQSQDDDKFKVVYPLVGVRNPFTKIKEYVSAVPFAAGFCTSADYNISMSQVKLPATVIDLERNLTISEQVQLTKNGINPIINKVGRGIIFASDYTMSKNTSLTQDTVRRAKDFFGLTFDAALQPYLSKPVTPTLWKQMKSALDTFLLGEWKANRIGLSDGSKPFLITINSSNNPSSIVALNRVIIDGQISLLGNADVILMYLNAGQENTIIG